MNKLIVDNVDEVSDIIVTEDMEVLINLSDTLGYINFRIMDNMCLSVLECSRNTKNKIIYTLEEKAKVIVNKIAVDCSDTTTINLNGRDADITYNTSIINENNDEYVQLINHNSENTSSNISNHIVNINDKDFKLIVNADISNDSDECKTSQDNKIINMGSGKNIIEPNLIVNNNLIQAQHSAYIGKFKENVLFYVKSRGIGESDAYKMLINGFLMDKFILDNNSKEKVVQFINNYL